jgi:hypothetical protein
MRPKVLTPLGQKAMQRTIPGTEYDAFTPLLVVDVLEYSEPKHVIDPRTLEGTVLGEQRHPPERKPVPNLELVQYASSVSLAGPKFVCPRKIFIS